MDSLKLGLVGLSAAEESLVKTLFRLHKVEPSFIWTLASAPPFDALLVDAESGATSHLNLKGKGTKVKFLGRLHDEAEGVMPRPIRSDLLVNWLNSIEVGILHGSHDLYASTEGEQHSDVPGSMRRVSRSRWKIQSLLGAEVNDALDAFESGARAFKLKRWPPQELLQGDVSRIRIATLLSRKHLGLKDLASLSRVPAERCLVFVRSLIKAQLLASKDVGVAAVSSHVPAVMAASSGGDDVETESPAPSRARGLRSSLIASIRKRFGIL